MVPMDLIYQNKAEIALITINRPKVLNALSSSLLNELLTLLGTLKEKVVIITGSGDRSFVAGADIREMVSMNEAEWVEYCRLGRQVFSLLEAGPFVSIAAINGYAFGGGMELLLACDLVVASEGAVLGLPEVKLGVIPSFSGIQRLSKAVGKYRALEWLLTGKNFTAAEGKEIGIVNKIAPRDQLIPACESLAKEIVENSFDAVLGVKKVVLGIEDEEEVSLHCFTKKERMQRMEAFLKGKKHAE
jgi:enoyl-CoA hydratase